MANFVEYFCCMRGELSLIEIIRRKSLNAKGIVRVGIGDDAAVLRPEKGEELVVTTDFSLEGVHFAEFHPARSVGHRCLARGLSDIAAMGARPAVVFLSLALSKKWVLKPAKVRDFLQGLTDLAQLNNVILAGGDTAGLPTATVGDIVVLGRVKTGRALLRSGAKVGDSIYVTGTLGGSAAELEALRKNPKKYLRAKPGGDHPHLFPQPRIGVGLRLGGLASACMDISDGLSTDLHHLCKASGVGAEIDAELLPVHDSATLAQALHGGEDYELLFTSAKKIPGRLAGVPVSRIGRVVDVARRVRIVVDGRASKLVSGGWEHLR